MFIIEYNTHNSIPALENSRKLSQQVQQPILNTTVAKYSAHSSYSLDILRYPR